MTAALQDSTLPRDLAPSSSFRARFLREVCEAGLLPGPSSSRPVEEADLDGLLEAAQRYLRFMRVLGQPRTWSLRARSVGAFRMGPDARWLACEAWQYDTRLAIARIFHMRMRLRGLLPMVVRDTYVHGVGRMQGRVLDAFGVVDEADEKLAVGELVTYLNDAIFYAPSMLLGPATTWLAVDPYAFDVILADHRRSVRARILLDTRGAAMDFITEDRFVHDPAEPGPMVRARWSTPVRGWSTVRGRPVATGGRAIWHLPSVTFAYADFRTALEDLTFDVAPTDRGNV